MDYRREIERKFIVDGASPRGLNGINSLLLEVLPKAKMAENTTSYDQYWAAPGVDFVRLRQNSHEITVKVTDKGTVTDRIEENVIIDGGSNMQTAARLLTLLFGPPCLKLTKRFTVLNVTLSPAPGTEFSAVVCLYEVKEDLQKRVFLEVEAESLPVVDRILDLIIPNIPLKPENRSLFQIFNGGR